MPDVVKRNVERWAELNPDFEICQWNESNIDVSEYEFGRRALENKKWGFLVDIIRPQKLVEEGGFYVDADVEMIRPLSELDVDNWGEKLLMGYMYDCALGTAVLYSPPQHPYLKEILHSYHYIKPDIWPVSNKIFTAYFINKVQGFFPNGKPWENDVCRLFQKEFFEQPAFIKSRGICIHHCCGSWQKELKNFVFTPRTNPFSYWWKWLKIKRRMWIAVRDGEFAPFYAAAKNGKRLQYDLSTIYTVDNPFHE